MDNESNELKRILHYYENLIAKLPGHVFWKDKNGVFLGCNDNQAQTLGLSSWKEVVGKKTYDMVWYNQPEDDRQHQAEIIDNNDRMVMESGVPQILEEPLVLPNGEIAIFLSNKTPLYDEEENIAGILGVSFDITDKKKTEQQLLETQQEIKILTAISETKEYLENIIAHMPGHVYWKDKNGVILGCNNLQANDAGFSSTSEMIGKTEYDMPWKDHADTILKFDQDIMNSGCEQALEESFILPDGTERIFLSQKKPLYDRKGHITGILGISFDITDKKRAEQRLLAEIQTKLQGMTLLSAIAAHELRTPLVTIGFNLETLRELLYEFKQFYITAKTAHPELTDISEQQFQLMERTNKAIEAETKTAFNFIEMLLMKVNLAVDQSATENFGMAECVDEALVRYPLSSEQRQLIHWETASNFIVQANRLFVIHVLFNLLKNAWYYIEKSGKLDAAIYIWLEQGTLANKLYFKDTGTGIAADILPHIFEPFFSKTRHGAGIGLTFCKTVMEAVGGSLTCESVENHYTQFVLTFPGI